MLDSSTKSCQFCLIESVIQYKKYSLLSNLTPEKLSEVLYDQVKHKLLSVQKLKLYQVWEEENQVIHIFFIHSCIFSNKSFDVIKVS